MKAKTIKQHICIALVLSMVLSFCSCGKKPKEVETTTSDTDVSEEVSDTESMDEEVEDSSIVESGSTDTGSATNTVQGSGKGQSVESKSGGGSKNPTKAGGGGRTSLTLQQVVANMPSELKGTTLKFFFWEDPRNLVYKDAINNFEKDTGISVQIVMATHQAYVTDLAAAVAAGNSPDVFKLIENNPGNVSNLQPITNSGYNFNDTYWDEEAMKYFT